MKFLSFLLLLSVSLIQSAWAGNIFHDGTGYTDGSGRYFQKKLIGKVPVKTWDPRIRCFVTYYHDKFDYVPIPVRVEKVVTPEYTPFDAREERKFILQVAKEKLERKDNLELAKTLGIAEENVSHGPSAVYKNLSIHSLNKQIPLLGYGDTQFGYGGSGNYFSAEDLRVHNNQVDQNIKNIQKLHEQVLQGQREAGKDLKELLIIEQAGATTERLIRSTLKAEITETEVTASSGSATHSSESTSSTPSLDVSASQAIFNSHCKSCHGSEDPEGGLDLSKAENLTASQWTEVALRVLLGKDEKGFMPQGGDPLPQKDQDELFDAAKAAAAAAPK